MSSLSRQAEHEEKGQFQLKGQRKTGPWSENQILLYVIFLEKNKHIFNSKKLRKLNRIFQRMSSFIGTRDALQSRSHHQKLLHKFQKTTEIISRFKKVVGKKQFKTQYLQYADGSKKPVQIQLTGNRQKQTADYNINAIQPMIPQQRQIPLLRNEGMRSESNQGYQMHPGYFAAVNNMFYSSMVSDSMMPFITIMWQFH